MVETVSGYETILSIESCPLKSTFELSSLHLTDLPLVSFDLPFFKNQLKRFCDQISNPIPLISSNLLENVEQLLSPKFPDPPSFKINPALTEVHYFLKINSYLKSIEHTTSRVEKLEVQAFKTASHLSSSKSRVTKLEELKEKKRWLEEELKKVNNELDEASTNLHMLQNEASKSQSMLTKLIHTLRTMQKEKAAQTPLLENNINSLQTVLSEIRDVINSHL
ncbi:hypothetical protein RHGRI_030620 [Rhododendron griersonianum]|uniref:Uncharacterized protein n=1 Tax=Rhododendron griersonianum TaxID=479676 RepID=A0AAV6I540_9ERIC|nr:hypothetical protein RHGRI_030620 [Rhododendron griersonianum]